MTARAWTELPAPPWIVAGTTVWLEKDPEKKELRILVPDGCMSKLRDDSVVELVTFVEVTRVRFHRVLAPLGWKVLS